MSLSTDLAAIGYFTVGVGGAVSPAYPLLSFRERVSVIGPDGVASIDPLGASLGGALRIAWTMRTFAEAANQAALAALIVTIQSQLCRRGQRITLVDFGGTARQLPEEGAAGGSLPGWPRCEYTENARDGAGTYLEFEISAETIVPKPKGTSGGFNLVEHEWELLTDIDKLGRETVRRSGTARVQNGQNARAYVQAAVIDPAETDASANDRPFLIKWTEGPDASTVKYEYTDGPEPDGSAGGGVTNSEINDRTSKQAEGRVVRTISGYAIGGGATTYVNSLRPTPDATHLLMRNEVSAPKVPDGRVDFTYEVLHGVIDSRFSTGAVFSFSQSLSEIPGGRRAQSAVYADRNPHSYLAGISPYRYVETTRIAFTNRTFTQAMATVLLEPLMAAANLVAQRVANKTVSAAGVRELTLTREYVFDAAPVSVPDPKEVETPT